MRGQANYAASKAGMIALAKSIAQELGSRGIRANAIAPGFILTDMTAALSDEVRAEWAKKIPLRRGGTPEDVANIATFLAFRYVFLRIRSGDSGRWWYEYVIEQYDCRIRRQPYNCSQQDRFRDCPGRQDGRYTAFGNCEAVPEREVSETRKCFHRCDTRLDRPVSGLVIFAKTSKALTRLNEMFRTSEVKKTYWAVVRMPPKSRKVNWCIIWHVTRSRTRVLLMTKKCRIARKRF